MSFSGKFVYQLIQYAGHKGVNEKDLISLTGHPLQELLHEETRLEAPVYDLLISQMVAKSQDQLFGLHAGEQMNLSAAGIVGQISLHAGNVREALSYCCEYSMLGCRSIPLRLEQNKEEEKLIFTPDPVWEKGSFSSSKQTLDGLMAFTIQEFHTLSLNKQYPILVRLKSVDAEQLNEYERVFGCKVESDQKENAIVFHSHQLNDPVITGNYHLLRTLVEYANNKLKELEQLQGFKQVVRKSIVSMVKPQFPTIEQVAYNLNLSVRTLQRKLSAEGFTYKFILDELRKDFAINYLKDCKLTINDVAYLLNYSDTSAFIRSFKRWTGITPTAHRLIHTSK